jgi:hypothetical protein
MNVEIGTETPIFLSWEYLFRNFGILSLQCSSEFFFQLSKKLSAELSLSLFSHGTLSKLLLSITIPVALKPRFFVKKRQ